MELARLDGMRVTLVSKRFATEQLSGRHHGGHSFCKLQASNRLAEDNEQRAHA